MHFECENDRCSSQNIRQRTNTTTITITTGRANYFSTNELKELKTLRKYIFIIFPLCMFWVEIVELSFLSFWKIVSVFFWEGGNSRASDILRPLSPRIWNHTQSHSLSRFLLLLYSCFHFTLLPFPNALEVAISSLIHRLEPSMTASSQRQWANWRHKNWFIYPFHMFFVLLFAIYTTIISYWPNNTNYTQMQPLKGQFKMPHVSWVHIVKMIFSQPFDFMLSLLLAILNDPFTIFWLDK